MLRRGRGRLRQCRPPWVTEVLRAIKPRRLIRRGVDRKCDRASQQEIWNDLPLPCLNHGLIGVCNPFVHVVLALWCPASHRAAGHWHVEPATGFCPLVADGRQPLVTIHQNPLGLAGVPESNRAAVRGPHAPLRPRTPDTVSILRQTRKPVNTLTVYGAKIVTAKPTGPVPKLCRLPSRPPS